MSIKYLGFEKLELTPQLATDFATMPGCTSERPLKEKRLKWLSSLVADGLFYPPRWATAVLTTNGQTYRVNGQHSSNMLASLNGSFPSGMLVIVDRFAVESDVEMAQLFQQFDNGNTIRTNTETLNAYHRLYPDLADIPLYKVKVILGGMSQAMSQNGDSRNPITENVRLLETDRTFIHWVMGFGLQPHMFRVPVVAAMYRTWQRDREQSSRFWALVRDESHAHNRNPTRVYATFLRSLPAKSVPLKKRDSTWAPRAIYVKGLHAWNAWRRGSATELKYSAKSPVPQVF